MFIIAVNEEVGELVGSCHYTVAAKKCMETFMSGSFVASMPASKKEAKGKPSREEAPSGNTPFVNNSVINHEMIDCSRISQVNSVASSI